MTASLRDARALAALYMLREYLEGRALPPAEARDRIDALLRPFVPLDGLLMPVLRLDEAIAEAEARIPAVEAARAAHLTAVEPALLC